MIIDWHTMEPWIPGEGVDAAGVSIVANATRVDTVTGEVWIPTRDSRGRLVVDEEKGCVHLTKIQMVPPLTIWLYT